MGRNFEEIFEECLSALLEGRRSVEDCLSLYPSLADELEPLLRTAAEIAPAFDYRPSDAIREEARQRFLAAARRRRQRALASARRPSAPWWQWMPLAAAATVALGVLALLGATLMNENGGGGNFSGQVSVRLATPTPEPVPASLDAPMAQARVQLEALETAVQQGQPIGTTVLGELREANRLIAAQLDDPSTVRDRDLAAARSLASRQYCLLSQVKGQVPPVQAADVEETLEATENVLRKLGVPVPESSSTPQASPAPGPSPSAASSPQGSPQPSPTTPASVCPAPSQTPASTPTPQQSPSPVGATPSQSLP